MGRVPFICEQKLRPALSLRQKTLAYRKQLRRYFFTITVVCSRYASIVHSNVIIELLNTIPIVPLAAQCLFFFFGSSTTSTRLV